MVKQAPTLMELDKAADEPIEDVELPDSDADASAASEPKPGDPDYDWSKHYDTDDLFYYTLPDGKVVALKSMAVIYSKTWLYKIRKLQTDAQVMIYAIERASCPIARELLDDLDDTKGDPLADLWKAYQLGGTSNGDGDEGLTPGN